MVASAYLRLGWLDAYYELNEKYGFLKAGVVTLFCLAAFYLYDLYDFVVMHDRRELILRLIQALGLAWVPLAILIYAVPPMMIGRGVSLVELPLALVLMVAWRVVAHWLLGHPSVGEKILVVGSGPSAIEVSGDVAIEECASFYERLTRRVSLDMMRPSWLIFSGRGRQGRLSAALRTAVHRFVALAGAVLSLPLALLTAALIMLD